LTERMFGTPPTEVRRSRSTSRFIVPNPRRFS
jgi:hypothetical protein